MHCPFPSKFVQFVQFFLFVHSFCSFFRFFLFFFVSFFKKSLFSACFMIWFKAVVEMLVMQTYIWMTLWSSSRLIFLPDKEVKRSVSLITMRRKLMILIEYLTDQYCNKHNTDFINISSPC